MRHTAIITNPDEPVVQLVLKELELLQRPYFIFYPHLFPEKKTLSISFKETLSGEIIIDGKSYSIEDIESVWYWKPFSTAQNLKRTTYQKFVRNESRTALWSFYTSLEDRIWVNNPLQANKLVEDNKLYQLKVAKEVGLEIPTTLISNNPDEVRNFVSRYGRVAAKQLYTQVFLDGNNPLLLYTNVITERDLESSEMAIAACPLFLQEYVEKAYELRITVVRDNVFTAKIDSQSLSASQHDWRKAGYDLPYQPYSLPDNIAAGVRALVKKLGLVYGAVDMIVTPDGNYIFLEINPNGRWGWIQDSCNLNIAKALAEELIKK